MFLSRYLDQEHGPKEDAENDKFDFSPLLLAAVITPIFFTILTACVCCYSPRLSSAIDNLVNANNREESDRVYANTIRRQQMEEEERNKEDPIERRARLIDYFEKKLLKLVVTDELLIHSKKRSDSALLTEKTESVHSAMSHHSLSSNEEDVEMQNPEDMQVHIPETTLNSDGFESATNNGGRLIPNCCAICLCAYDVGDSIVWSNNKDCIHAFHEECILDYLQRQKTTPCPCCRREFTDLLPKNEQKASRQERGASHRNMRDFVTRILHRVRYSSVAGE